MFLDPEIGKSPNEVMNLRDIGQGLQLREPQDALRSGGMAQETACCYARPRAFAINSYDS